MNDPDWLSSTGTPVGFSGMIFPPNVTSKFQGRLKFTSSPIALANSIIQTPYSIGYAVIAPAIKAQVPVATIINMAGIPISPTPQASALAATEVMKNYNQKHTSSRSTMWHMCNSLIGPATQ